MSESVASLKAVSILSYLALCVEWRGTFSNMPCSRHPGSLSGVHCMSQFYQAFTRFGAASDKSQVSCKVK